MSVLDSFKREWQSQVRPTGLESEVDISAPELDCFDLNGSLTKASIEEGLSRCRRSIKDLESELRRKRFVEQFLTNCLIKQLTNGGAGEVAVVQRSSSVKSNDPSKGIEAKLDDQKPAHYKPGNDSRQVPHPNKYQPSSKFPVVQTKSVAPPIIPRAIAVCKSTDKDILRRTSSAPQHQQPQRRTVNCRSKVVEDQDAYRETIRNMIYIYDEDTADRENTDTKSKGTTPDNNSSNSCSNTVVGLPEISNGTMNNNSLKIMSNNNPEEKILTEAPVTGTLETEKTPDTKQVCEAGRNKSILRRFQNIQEEAEAMVSFTGSDNSSGDDEELNLMVLHQSVCRASQWCADIDSSRERLSQQAHHLSNRFSYCLGDSPQMSLQVVSNLPALDVVQEMPLSPYLFSREDTQF